MSSPEGVETGELSRLADASVVPRRRVGSKIAGLVTLLILAWMSFGVVNNRAFGWHVVGQYLFSHEILRGLWLTLWLTTLVSALGFALGTLLAVMRLSGNPVLRAASAGYVWIFRSVPLLVLLLFFYNIGYLLPVISIGLPLGPSWLEIPTRDLVSALMAAIIALTCHEAAYAAEIVRGGIISVNPGLIEAGKALGLSAVTIFRHITFPRALPSILPAAGNLFIGTLKGTSIVSIIAVSDLLYSSQLIYNSNYQIVPLLLVATIWYVVTTTILAAVQTLIERHYRVGP
jgi:polar amino acid transport system permease protein